MKKRTVANWSAGLLAASLPILGGCTQKSEAAAPAVAAVANPVEAASETMISNASDATLPTAESPIESAPAKIVSTPQPAPQSAALNSAASDIAKLAQAGVDESVMLAFVTNSPHTFNLSSDQIIYLNDIGVSGNVVTAMIQHDQALQLAGTPPPAAPAPVTATTPAAPVVAESQPAPIAEDATSQDENVASGCFYDSLAPYGNWIDVTGYGLCWQPTVVVVNRSWVPYGDCGHWVYTDCGWYWVSDYSWGWAPFHYGRWFRHNLYGWCWAPDTVWAPAWVSWRYSADYCGWAPLPPTAVFRAGIGFTYLGRPVGASFGFRLGADYFTFVAANRFTDTHPFHHHVPPREVKQIFSQTTMVNPVVDGQGGSQFHHGIPVGKIAEATHSEIRQVKVRDAAGLGQGDRGEYFDRATGSLSVYRPQLPELSRNLAGTRVGEGVKPAALQNHPYRNNPAQPAIAPDQRVSGWTSENSFNRAPENARQNGGEIPLNSLIVKSRATPGLPSNPQTTSDAANQPNNNRRDDYVLTRHQLPLKTTTSQSFQNSAWQASTYYQQRQEQITQPMFIQRQYPQAMWNAPAAPSAPVEEQRSYHNPPAERALPAPRPAENIPAAPRPEFRPAPAAAPAPPPAPVPGRRG